MMLLRTLGSAALALLLAGQGTVSAIELNINDPNSIKNAAAISAYNMMSNYTGNQTGQIPGKLPGTWWEGGAMFMTLIQYWYFSGDDSYNPTIIQGMDWQKGNDDFFPSNYSQYLGNDDQVFWGLAAMTAAELNFPQQDGQPSWVSLAQGVFNTQVPRWDSSNCGGGLRWQIWPYQAGYTTKNAISNGGLFQLSARLARYTNNQTYADWAGKIWDWSSTTPLLKESDWTIADTTSVAANCQDHGDLQWTYNYGTYLSGAAYMYNLTNADPKWKTGIDGLLATTLREFFPAKYGGNIMSEFECESLMTCDRNQDCFKGFLSSWLAFLTTIVPYTEPEIMPKLQGSAVAAAKQCTGGANQTLCGRRWYQPSFDGTSSLEEEMSALSIFSSNLLPYKNAGGPLTAATGGTSKSNPTAGTGSHDQNPFAQKPITTADRAGAGVLTVVFLVTWAATLAWMLRGD